MSSADWTSIATTGSFSIVANGSAPSGPDVMQINPGGQVFQNITGGTFKDSRVSGWCNLDTANNSRFYLVLRSLNTTFLAAPATFFLVDIRDAGGSFVSASIYAVVNGVQTLILSLSYSSLNGNPSNTWQQFQFSTFNSGTDILIRLAQWNGSAFIPVMDCAAPIASFPALDAAGSCRFGANSVGLALVLVDDVNYYSLT